MERSITQFSLLVKEYDEAIEFYISQLNFILLEDTVLSDTKRWVRMAPSTQSQCSILLAKASNEEQKSRIGNQTGGRVFMFMHTDHIESEYQNLLKHNIEIVRGPVQEEYGKVIVFKDLYGNLWDLIEPNKAYIA